MEGGFTMGLHGFLGQVASRCAFFSTTAAVWTTLVTGTFGSGAVALGGRRAFAAFIAWTIASLRTGALTATTPFGALRMARRPLIPSFRFVSIQAGMD